MTLFSVWGRRIISVLLAASLAGCSFTNVEQDEKKDAHYLTGKYRQQNMDYKGAAEAFEKALEANPQSAAAHLELGLLYAEKLNEGVTTEEERGRNLATAIYHLEKYVQLNPKSAWAGRVRGQIDGCKYELAKTAPFTLLPNTVQAELERLNSTNKALYQQVQQLKLQLAQQAHVFSNHVAALQSQTLAAPIAAVSLPPSASAVKTNSALADSAVATKPLPPSAPKQMMASQRPSSSRLVTPVGTQSRLPASASSRAHTVRSGETFASIARAYAIPLGSLIAANPGMNPRKLKVGDSLNLPASKG